jgi:hypothetical protein
MFIFFIPITKFRLIAQLMTLFSENGNNVGLSLRGFDLESTHLQCPKKLSKLLVFISIMVALRVKIGEYCHEKVQKIKTKKHGYKANSFFRKGLFSCVGGLKI